MAAGELILQSTVSLVPPVNWQADGHPVQTNGLWKSVIIDLGEAARFYSLGSP